MRKVNYLLVVFMSMLTGISFVACTDDDFTSGGGGTSEPGEHFDSLCVLPDNLVGHLAEKVESDSLLLFDASTPEAELPKVGECIYIPQSANAPYGFMGKVVSVEKGIPIKVFTETVALDEVVETASVDTTITGMMKNISGVYDADGNPVPYELQDTLMAADGTRAGGYYEDWKVKIPFSLPIKKGDDEFENATIKGAVTVGIKDFRSEIDIDNWNTRYINIGMKPYCSLSLDSEIKIETKTDKLFLIGSFTTNVTVMVGPVPVVMPVSLNIYIAVGANGKISTTFSIQKKCSFDFYVLHENGLTTADCNVDTTAQNPLTVAKFEASGELYVGPKLDISVGLYTNKLAVGLEILPKFSLSGTVSLTSENLLKINPLIELALKMTSDVYFKALLFTKKNKIDNSEDGKHKLPLPTFTIWSEKMTLLPSYEEFTTSNDTVNYKLGAHYLLSGLGMKSGIVVYDTNGTTQLKELYPTHSATTDIKGRYACSEKVTGLTAGKTYYVAPYVSWGTMHWVGEKIEITLDNGTPEINSQLVGTWKILKKAWYVNVNGAETIQIRGDVNSSTPRIDTYIFSADGTWRHIYDFMGGGDYSGSYKTVGNLIDMGTFFDQRFMVDGNTLIMWNDIDYGGIEYILNIYTRQ